MTDFFVGTTSVTDGESHFRKIDLGNMTLYNTEKINGFFIEELFFNITDKLKIKNKSILFYYSDDINHYCVFTNDMKMRETAVYSKEDIDDDSIEIIIENFMDDDIEIFIKVVESSNKLMKLEIYKNKIINTNADDVIEVDIYSIEKTVFNSKIDVIGKHLKSYTSKYYKTLIILIIGIGLNLTYYTIANTMITERLKDDRNILTTEETKLKKEVKNKKYQIKNITSNYKRVKGTKNIIDDPSRFISYIKRSFKE